MDSLLRPGAEGRGLQTGSEGLVDASNKGSVPLQNFNFIELFLLSSIKSYLHQTNIYLFSKCRY
jgi:hypothetical protein